MYIYVHTHGCQTPKKQTRERLVRASGATEVTESEASDVHWQNISKVSSTIIPHGQLSTGWRRPIGCVIIIGHVPQKRPAT